MVMFGMYEENSCIHFRSMTAEQINLSEKPVNKMNKSNDSTVMKLSLSDAMEFDLRKMWNKLPIYYKT